LDKFSPKDNIKPITEKKNILEEALKKDAATTALAKAIKSILTQDK
jgi:hypothetical protein